MTLAVVHVYAIAAIDFELEVRDGIGDGSGDAVAGFLIWEARCPAAGQRGVPLL